MKYTPPEKLSPVECFYEFLVLLPLLGPLVIYGLKMLGIHLVVY